jgi:hypothetical protein
MWQRVGDMFSINMNRPPVTNVSCYWRQFFQSDARNDCRDLDRLATSSGANFIMQKVWTCSVADAAPLPSP